MDKANKRELRVGIFLIILGLLIWIAYGVLVILHFYNVPLGFLSENLPKTEWPFQWSFVLLFCGGWFSLGLGAAKIMFVLSMRKTMRWIEKNRPDVFKAMKEVNKENT